MRRAAGKSVPMLGCRRETSTQRSRRSRRIKRLERRLVAAILADPGRAGWRSIYRSSFAGAAQ